MYFVGIIAQLGERSLDVRKAMGSSPVCSMSKFPPGSIDFATLPAFFISRSRTILRVTDVLRDYLTLSSPAFKRSLTFSR